MLIRRNIRRCLTHIIRLVFGPDAASCENLRRAASTSHGPRMPRNRPVMPPRTDAPVLAQTLGDPQPTTARSLRRGLLRRESALADMGRRLHDPPPVR